MLPLAPLSYIFVKPDPIMSEWKQRNLPPAAQGMVTIPDSKVHGANMGPIWGRQDPGGPHVVPMNLVIWDDVTRAA